MVARGNFEIDMDWADGAANTFTVTSRNGGEFSGEYKNIANATITDAKGNPVEFTKNSDDRVTFNTEKDGVYTITLPRANKSILNTVLAYAEAQYASDEFANVIDSVQKSFTAALENARAVDADPNASQEAVDSAWQTLMTEIHKLGFVRGDKSTLTQLVEISNSYNNNIDRYTPATAEPFVAALTAAQAVLDDGDAMQGDIAPVESALLDAMMNLRFKADKSVLEAVLAQANDVDLSTYSETELAAFNAAKAAAEAVYNDVNAEQDAVNDAVSALQAAIIPVTEAPNDTTTPTDTDITTPDAPTQGDTTLTTGGGNAKTGEAAPIALAVAAVSLVGAALFISKKRNR